MRTAQRLVGMVVLIGLIGGASIASGQQISTGLNLASMTAGFDRISGGGTRLDAGVTAERLLDQSSSVGLTVEWARVGVEEYSYSRGALGPLVAVYLTPGKEGSPYVAARATFGFGEDELGPDGTSDIDFSVGVGYLRLFGSEQMGAGLRVEAAYRHSRYGERIVGGDMIVPAEGWNHLRLDAGVSFYLH